jgi:hypothetical protein
MASPPKP